jgi:hypothetical protein
MAHNDNEQLGLKADVFNAMRHLIRLRVIEFLTGGEKCVCEIVRRFYGCRPRAQAKRLPLRSA